MSRELAHQILDDAKAGRLVSEEAIRQALRATGDLDHTPPWVAPKEDE
jgi:hypothetical protein